MYTPRLAMICRRSIFSNIFTSASLTVVRSPLKSLMLIVRSALIITIIICTSVPSAAGVYGVVSASHYYGKLTYFQVVMNEVLRLRFVTVLYNGVATNTKIH